LKSIKKNKSKIQTEHCPINHQ